VTWARIRRWLGTHPLWLSLVVAWPLAPLTVAMPWNYMVQLALALGRLAALRCHLRLEHRHRLHSRPRGLSIVPPYLAALPRGPRRPAILFVAAHFNTSWPPYSLDMVWHHPRRSLHSEPPSGRPNALAIAAGLRRAQLITRRRIASGKWEVTQPFEPATPHRHEGRP